MFPWSSPNKYNLPQGYHFPFTYIEAQDKILNHLFCLSAYRIDLQNISLSYEASLENATNTQAVMYFNPSSHSAIVSINFVIILQLPCPSKIMMKPICNIENIKFISLVLQELFFLSPLNRLKYTWNHHLPTNRIDILVKHMCHQLLLPVLLNLISKLIQFSSLFSLAYIIKD